MTSIDAPSRSEISFAERMKAEWWSNPRTDLLSGLVVALALIPEAISFSIIAGVDPKVGLYASFSIAIIISIAGGRSGMISAATGAMALVLVPLVEEYGVTYLFAATILACVIQVGLGYLGIGELMRFVPRTVMVGFVNAWIVRPKTRAAAIASGIIAGFMVSLVGFATGVGWLLTSANAVNPQTFDIELGGG